MFNFSDLVFLSIELLPLHEGMFLESWVQLRKIFADLNLGENVSIRSFPTSICLTSISVCFNKEIHNSVLKKYIFNKLSRQVYHKICSLNIYKQYNNSFQNGNFRTTFSDHFLQTPRISLIILAFLYILSAWNAYNFK